MNKKTTEAAKLTAVIFQETETKTKDAAGKELSYIHSLELAPDNVKKTANVFLGTLLHSFFTPESITVNKGTATEYSINKAAKVDNLKGLRVSFQFNGKQVFITNKARLTSCIGKGINSLNFQKLVFQLLGLIAENTDNSELLTAIATEFKAAGKTPAQIAELTDDAKIEISKTGVKLANVAIRAVRTQVRENSAYGVYVQGIAESRKALKAAENKQVTA